jgi:hypothetical protein
MNKSEYTSCHIKSNPEEWKSAMKILAFMAFLLVFGMML